MMVKELISAIPSMLSGAVGGFMNMQVVTLAKIGAVVGSAIYTAYVSIKSYRQKKRQAEEAKQEEDIMRDFMEFSACEGDDTVEETLHQVRKNLGKKAGYKAKKNKKHMDNESFNNIDLTARTREELRKFNDGLKEMAEESSFFNGFGNSAFMFS